MREDDEERHPQGQQLGATATTMFATVSNHMHAHSSRRRSTLAVASVTARARKPGMVIIRPAVPSEMAKVPPIDVTGRFQPTTTPSGASTPAGLSTVYDRYTLTRVREGALSRRPRAGCSP